MGVVAQFTIDISTVLSECRYIFPQLFDSLTKLLFRHFQENPPTLIAIG